MVNVAGLLKVHGVTRVPFMEIKNQPFQGLVLTSFSKMVNRELFA
jgi:hypothetical protein